MNKLKIMIVDDDPNIQQLISLYLTREGFDVTTAAAGDEALRLFKSDPPNLMLLDIMLPVMDGWQVCREVRKVSNIPIIMLTAKDETFDKVLGLELGADDYITKPFDPAEVLARVRSHLRRYTRLGGAPAAEASHGYTVGPITLDEEAKTVTVDGDPVSLTPIEFRILALLMKHPGRIYSSAQIYELVWKEDSRGAETSVAVHIRHLRQKIEINPSEPRYLKVVWGLGYKLEDSRHEKS